MHRIDGFGHTPDNKFTEGNPVSAIPATIVTADWLNAVQEEIASVIEGAGETLDKPDNGQLLLAIQQIVAASQGFSTGDVKLTLKAVADAGWIMADDGTIGSASSGATTRANADTQALYTLLWNNVSNTWAPVTGGRGASAAADFAANKPLKLTRVLGRALGIAGSGSTLTARQLGEFLGAETHTLSLNEMPAHTHNTAQMGLYAAAGYSVIGSGGTGVAQMSQGTTSAGSGATHNNMQPTVFLNAMVKL